MQRKMTVDHFSFQKDRKPGDESDNCRFNESNPHRVWLKRGFPRKIISTDSLSFENGLETNITKQQSGPCNQASDSAEVQKPREGLRSVTRPETFRIALALLPHRPFWGGLKDWGILLRYAKRPKSHAIITAIYGTAFFGELRQVTVCGHCNNHS